MNVHVRGLELKRRKPLTLKAAFFPTRRSTLMTRKNLRKRQPPRLQKCFNAASYPDVSLLMKMCAQRKAGKTFRLYPSLGPLRFITSHSFRARLCHAKNEAPEEEAGINVYRRERKYETRFHRIKWTFPEGEYLIRRYLYGKTKGAKSKS